MIDGVVTGGGSIAVDENAIHDPCLATLYSYWSARRPDQGFPRPDEIEPGDLVPIIAYVLMIKILPGEEFLFEMVGHDVHAHYDPTGKTLAQSVPPGLYYDHIVAQYRMALRGREPVYTQVDYFGVDGGLERSMHRLFLPLSEKGRAISHLLMAQKSTQDTPWQTPLWETPLSRIVIRETIPLF